MSFVKMVIACKSQDVRLGQHDDVKLVPLYVTPVQVMDASAGFSRVGPRLLAAAANKDRTVGDGPAVSECILCMFAVISACRLQDASVRF